MTALAMDLPMDLPMGLLMARATALVQRMDLWSGRVTDRSEASS